jgi:hypothetical protein
VATAWFDPNPSDVLQTFDQTEHGGRCGSFRHLSQPREPTQAGLFPLRERIEPTYVAVRLTAPRSIADALLVGPREVPRRGVRWRRAREP